GYRDRGPLDGDAATALFAGIAGGTAAAPADASGGRGRALSVAIERLVLPARRADAARCAGCVVARTPGRAPLPDVHDALPGGLRHQGCRRAVPVHQPGVLRRVRANVLGTAGTHRPRNLARGAGRIDAKDGSGAGGKRRTLAVPAAPSCRRRRMAA